MKYNTIHLFYHRFREKSFFKTLIDATKRKTERGNTAEKYFFRLCYSIYEASFWMT